MIHRVRFDDPVLARWCTPELIEPGWNLMSMLQVHHDVDMYFRSNGRTNAISRQDWYRWFDITVRNTLIHCGVVRRSTTDEPWYVLDRNALASWKAACMLAASGGV